MQGYSNYYSMIVLLIITITVSNVKKQSVKGDWETFCLAF